MQEQPCINYYLAFILLQAHADFDLEREVHLSATMDDVIMYNGRSMNGNHSGCGRELKFNHPANVNQEPTNNVAAIEPEIETVMSDATRQPNA